MKILYTNYPDGYNELRNFINPNLNKVEYRRSRDLFGFILALLYRFTGKGYWPFFKGLYFNPFSGKKEFHFFNTILVGSNCFEVTFESILPRLGDSGLFWQNLAVKHLASANCLKIWALSQCAFNMQVDYLKTNYPKLANIIVSKMAIRYPFQPLLIKKYEDKLMPSDKVVFTFTGADFFRKGGMEILRAFEELIPKYPDLHLNIVSSMNYGDYATHTGKKNQLDALAIIDNFHQNVTHYWSLPNSDVLELYKRSHIGILPSWADSFGYSVLEAQAAGCPCITTDIRSLPEINNDDIGWLIKLNKRIYNKDNSSYLTRKIILIIDNIFSDEERTTIKLKGLGAMKSISTKCQGFS